jgi:hypothetical protein
LTTTAAAHHDEGATMQNPREIHDSISPEVLDLLEQRTAVEQWLARLEQQRGKVSDHVLERVRDDYERRLQDALDSLATHRRVIQEEMERATARVIAAETEHRSALDELEETRLRNMIGELDDDAWREREFDLTEAVRVASGQENEAREETERLRALLDQLEGRRPESNSEEEALLAFEPTPDAEPGYELGADDEIDDRLDDDLDSDLDDDLDEFSTELDEESVTPPHGDVLREEVVGNDSFLTGIDRQLTSSPERQEESQLSWIPTAEGEKTGEEETAPKPGLKCGECGYTNDLSAWFCGVCGADVG